MDLVFWKKRYWIYELSTKGIYHLGSDGKEPELLCDNLERIFWPGMSIYFFPDSSLLLFQSNYSVRVFEITEDLKIGASQKIDLVSEMKHIFCYSRDIFFTLQEKIKVGVFRVRQEEEKMFIEKIKEVEFESFQDDDDYSTFNFSVDRENKILVLENGIMDSWQLVEIFVCSFDEEFQFTMVYCLDCSEFKLDYFHFFSPLFFFDKGFFFFALSGQIDKNTLAVFKFDQKESKLGILEDMNQDFDFENIYKLVDARKKGRYVGISRDGVILYIDFELKY